METPKLVQNLGFKNNQRIGIYECPQCNNNFTAYTSNVKTGNTTKCRSCKNLNQTTHNMTKSKLYAVYTNMKSRCNNIHHHQYCDYGARDILICEEWSSFESFKAWALSSGYSDGLSIDRINPYSGYHPLNCRWTTKEVQARNTKILPKHNKSGYRGVMFYKQKWQAQIHIFKKVKYLGRYDTPLEAGLAYDRFVIANNLEHTTNFRIKNIIGN